MAGLDIGVIIIAVSLKKFLEENRLGISEEKISQIFSSPHVFCKTDNRKVLGHMNDFKRCVEVSIYCDGQSFNEINWDEIMRFINNTPIGTRDYRYINELAIKLFSELTTHPAEKLI